MNDVEKRFRKYFAGVIHDYLRDPYLTPPQTFELESRPLGPGLKLVLGALTYKKGKERVIDYHLRLTHSSGLNVIYGTPTTSNRSQQIIPNIPLEKLWDKFYGLSDEMDFFCSSFDEVFFRSLASWPIDNNRCVISFLEKV